MSEEEFDTIADSFRDPRVWWKDDGDNWEKHNMWDDEITREEKERRRLRWTNR